MHRHYEILIKKNGERFNIFNILKLSTKEVRLHSAFIAELMNPMGSHGMQDYFLKSFIEYLKKSDKDIFNRLSEFVTEKAFIRVERDMGVSNVEKTEGGRVDILIGDNERFIVIENKIHAGDQENQLVRYNSIENKVAFIYLTLFGTLPSEFSAADLVADKDFICLSYKVDILQWLHMCLNQNKEIPETVLYTLQQYTRLIKQITLHNNSTDMEKDIVSELTKTDENIEIAFLVANTLEKVKESRSKSLVKRILENLNDYEPKCDLSVDFHTFPRVEFYPHGWKYHLIGFTDEKGLFFGIKRVNEKEQPIDFNEIKPHIQGNYRTANWWLCYSHLEGENFNLDSALPWLQSNESMVASTMAEKIKLLVDISKSKPELMW